MQFDLEKRVEIAEKLFREGYNCAQAVFLTYADLFEMNEDLAARISVPFGGGMGRLREVCGACSGMFMVAGMALPADNPKAKTYALVQELAGEFKKQNGSIVCRELLGLDHQKDEPTPECRTENYYKKRPCVELVKMATKIVGEKISQLAELNNE